MGAADYIEINRESWNRRTEAHLQSAFYDVEGFVKGKSSLCPIELGLLGDIAGKKILHLQCHFGQDTISLARLGAICTGVDLSDKAIASANDLAVKTNTAVRFICCNIYDLSQHIDETFDIVFTSYGVIGWLPDMQQWGALISRYLKRGGQLIFAEFHPVVWMFDDHFEKIGYSYFNTAPIIETESGTYADRQAPITGEYVTWNHSLGDVLTALLSNGLELKEFQEYDYSPHNCFLHTKETTPGRYVIDKLGNKIPMVYALRAEKLCQ